MKNYLFICQHNFTRSIYGAEFFRGFLEGKKIQAKVDSAGIGLISFFLGKRVNKKILRNQYKIFVMEDYMKDYLVRKFNLDSTRIVVLDIYDDYGLFKKKDLNKLDKLFRKIKWENYLK
jgi:predicted protein tyrosine phosphatase